MKLLMCRKCGDMFNLSRKEKTCSCGETSGKYIDELNAEIKGDCQPIGIANQSFRYAYILQLEKNKEKVKKSECCKGVNFDAFFIPEAATSIERID